MQRATAIRDKANSPGKGSALVSLEGFLQVPHGQPPLLGSLHGWGESLMVTRGIGFAWPFFPCVHLPWEP